MSSGSLQKPNLQQAGEIWPEIESPVGRDDDLERRVADLVSQMSLEEKVGQIIQAEIQYTTPDDVRKYHLGSVLNGGGSLPDRNKHASPGDWLALADAYYEASMDTSDGGQPIPIIWGSDAVHGHNNVIGATIFPHNIGLGATRDPALIREIGRVTAREMRVTGIDWTFAPTVAVAQDDRWGRTYESYSEDPAVVRSYAGEFVKGLQGEPGSPEFLDANHVVATVKHYIGDGGTIGGDDQGDVQVSELELRDIHGQGYIAALEAGVQTAMASFSSWNGEKMHGHHYMLTTVLKERMGLDGIVVGDWNGHGQLPGCTNASCPDAINAGLDLFMVVEDWKELYGNTLEQARNGRIPLSRLDDAVSRILRVKMRAGLFAKGKPSVRGIAGADNIIGSAAHRDVARRAVRQSMVLLKNEGGVLPIAGNAHILVTGDGADSMQKQTGGWTITWQGTGNENSDFPGGSTILDGIRESVAQYNGSVTYSASGDFDNESGSRPDVAIVVFGEEPYAEFQGDLDTLEFEPVHKTSLKLLRKLKATGLPVVSVFLSGRPMWINPELNQSDAFVAAFLPGSEGAGVADVLIGDAAGEPRFDFTGRLSFSWPRTPLQAVLNAHHENYDPLFALDYGLSYQSPGEPVPVQLEIVEGIKEQAQDLVTLYHGRALAPWAVFIEGDTGVSSIMSGPYAAHVSGQIVVRTADMEVQEDALKLEFTGSGTAALYIDGGELDISNMFDEGVLTFAAKVDKPLSGDLMLTVNDRQIPVAEPLSQHAGKGWQLYSAPLSCFADDAASLSALRQAFRLSSGAALEVSVGKIQFLAKRPDESGTTLCN